MLELFNSFAQIASYHCTPAQTYLADAVISYLGIVGSSMSATEVTAEAGRGLFCAHVLH